MATFVFYLTLFTGFVALLVSVNFAMAWYEYANRDPQMLERGHTLRRLFFALRLIVPETFFLALTILLQPIGWLNRKQPSPCTTETPIIFLHGLMQSPACWLWLKFCLKRQGFTALYSIALPPWKDVEVLTERLARQVDRVRHATGLQKVHLVGHSMGGLIARNYLQIRGGAEKVDRCLLIGTPNGGSKMAPFSLSALGRLLMPGSVFLRRLAEAPLPAEARVCVLYSRHDNLVIPYENACLEGATAVELDRVGHVGLLFSRRVLQVLVDLLQEKTP